MKRLYTGLMSSLERVIKFFSFQSYLGRPAPSRELPTKISGYVPEAKIANEAARTEENKPLVDSKTFKDRFNAHA